MYWLKGAFVFLLLWEWFQPLPAIARFERFEVFIPLLAFLSFVAMLRIPIFLKELLKLTGSLSVLYYLFHDSLKTGQSWKDYVIQEYLINYEKVSRLDFAATTGWARTVVFILVLWIAVSIVYRAVLIRNRGVWFSLTTIAYFVLLDFTSQFDIRWPLVRSVVWILLLLSVLQMRFVERQGIQINGRKSNRYYWIFSSLAMIFAVTSIAYTLPKGREGETVAFRFMNQLSQQQKVGYETGDRRLGGPFKDDNSVVFYAETPEKVYWRGESRSIYTGSQWKDARGTRTELQEEGELGLEPLVRNMKVEDQKTMRVKFVQAKYDLLFYGGLPKELKRLDPQHSSLYTTGNQEIRVDYPTDNQAVSEYELNMALPLINEDSLKKSSTEYTADIHEYLQLPLGLPDRVRELAAEITKGHQDPYSKALAIQQYLKRESGLLYEKEEVPYIQQGQDFVDQFLFESKKGYCDHFSTSMVVLLRSAGIPARYVKGFSSGETVRRSDGIYEVKIRNKNAHSWTEVYFTGYGWVPFEPTPGFTNPTKIDYEEQKAEQQEAIPVSSLPPAPVEEPVDQWSKIKGGLQVGGKALAIGKWFNYMLVASIFTASLVIWKFRNRIRFWYLHRRVQKIDQIHGLSKIYLALMSLLGSVFSKRRNSESLLEYVGRLNVNDEIKEELTELTKLYERHVYGPAENEAKSLDEAKGKLKKILKHFFS